MSKMTHHNVGTPYYTQLIQPIAAQLGFCVANARHIEAYMRLEMGCLDGMNKARFAHEVELAIACIMSGGDDAAETLAVSFGL